GKTRRICLNSERSHHIRHDQQRGLCERRLQRPESPFLLHTPQPRHVLPLQPLQWLGDECVVLNEPTMEVGKPQELENLTDIPRCRPVRDAAHLHRIHADVAGRNLQPKVGDLLCPELTLCRVQEEVGLPKTPQNFPDLLVVL
ncbi:hypothetical protein BDV98DRAFT_635404, partial [Pterulicium gracile]